MMKRSSLFLLFNVGVVLVSPFSPLISMRASALSGAEFRPGRIIDDPYFTNKNAISVPEIQSTLNDLLASSGQRDGITGQCDNKGLKTSELGDGTRAQYGTDHNNPPDFTCLKDYYENTDTKANNYGGQPIPDGAKSAAQLIWDAGQAYNINPQVLLVTLQKEQRLLTDDWPFKNQLLYAMGAHCPDSGPGGTANCDTNYAGFGIQMKEASRLYRYYLDNMSQPWWSYKKTGINDILYNPSSSCGSSSVNIESQATAALYTYTPYQPNGAALSNLYGTGDGCSAYGNRNFWRMFNDWFGSSTGCPPVDSSLIYRLFRKSDGDIIYTQNPAEICQALQYFGYVVEGEAMKNDVGAADPGALSVYRLSRGSSHLFTVNPVERDQAMQTYRYVYEGVAFYESSDPLNHNTVYRVSKNGHYILTTSLFEKSAFVSSGFTDEGTPFYASTAASKIPIYRISKNGLHLYTSSEAEKNSAASQFGYNDEGVAFYGMTGSTGDDLLIYRLQKNKQYLNTIYPGEKTIALNSGYAQETSYFFEYPGNYAGTIPVYRLSNAKNGDYLLTTNTTEKDQAVQNYGYRLEGVGFGAPTP